MYYMYVYGRLEPILGGVLLLGSYMCIYTCVCIYEYIYKGIYMLYIICVHIGDLNQYWEVL